MTTNSSAVDVNTSNTTGVALAVTAGRIAAVITSLGFLGWALYIVLTSDALWAFAWLGVFFTLILLPSLLRLGEGGQVRTSPRFGAAREESADLEVAV